MLESCFSDGCLPDHLAGISCMRQHNMCSYITEAPGETAKERKEDDGLIHIDQLPLDMKMSQATVLILSLTQGDVSKQTFGLIPIFAAGRVFLSI